MFPYKNISANRYANVNEIFRSEGIEGDITTKLSQCRDDRNEGVCHIKHSLLGGTLREDGGLGNMKLQTCIFFEYTH